MDSPTSNNASSDAEKQRDRSRRSERGTRFSDNKDNDIRDRSRDRSGGGINKRVYVSNIPYEYRWQDLKASIKYTPQFLFFSVNQFWGNQAFCGARTFINVLFRLRLCGMTH